MFIYERKQILTCTINYVERDNFVHCIVLVKPSLKVLKVTFRRLNDKWHSIDENFRDLWRFEGKNMA